MHLNLTGHPTLELTVDEALSESHLNGLIQDVLRGYTQEAIASTALTGTNHEERVRPSTIFFHLSK